MGLEAPEFSRGQVNMQWYQPSIAQQAHSGGGASISVQTTYSHNRGDLLLHQHHHLKGSIHPPNHLTTV